MAASIRTCILIAATAAFLLFIFNRWVVMHMMDDVLRARVLRFQLTCIIVFFYCGVGLFNWANLSTLFDRTTSGNSKGDLSEQTSSLLRLGINWREISNWRQYTVKSALWRGFLMIILISSLLAYPTFTVLLSTEPYHLGYFCWLCLAVSVQLFTAIITLYIVRIVLKLVCKVNVLKRQSRLPSIFCVLYALGVVSVGFYNTFKIPEIREVNIPINGLPHHLNKLTITFVSDIHLGPTVGKTSLEKIVHMINYLHSDAVIIGGDLVDGRVDKMGSAVESLEWIKSKYGTYFVTGNHEYYTTDAHNWLTKLQSLGVKVLHNSNVVLKGDGETGICLAGVDDPTADHYKFMDHTTDIHGALKTCDSNSPVILVAHQPVTAKKALQSNYRVDLVISGHTHGGQMFPLIIGAYLFNPYYAGLYSYGEHSHVYVSMGTIYWGFPVRFGTRSEITKITLVTK